MNCLIILNNIYIVGKVCAEYNSGGRIIQRKSDAKCKECPSVYSSAISYLCKYLHKDSFLLVFLLVLKTIKKITVFLDTLK